MAAKDNENGRRTSTPPHEFSEAADHARRDREHPLRAFRGCFWWTLVGVALVVVGVWIWSKV